MANAPWPGAVAVSGGSDSLALMLLLADWAASRHLPPPTVVSVDHALRPESAGEARRVQRWAKQAGLVAKLLRRKGKAPRADVEAAARQARYGLIGEWARANGLASVYLGHTRDDQAETFLIRLGRGSGVDGLSAMRPLCAYPLSGFGDLTLVRPLLAIEREVLRDFLRARGQDWIEDPMNADPRFARVRIRNAWPALEAAGLGKGRIADAAVHLGRARAALDTVTEAVLASACRFDGESALLDSAALTAAPRELGLRALARILMEVSQSPYRPRFERLERLFDRIGQGASGTLHGCRITPAPAARTLFGKGTLLVRREEIRRKPGKPRLPKPKRGS